MRWPADSGHLQGKRSWMFTRPSCIRLPFRPEPAIRFCRVASILSWRSHSRKTAIDQSAAALKDDLARITRDVHPARRWTRRALAAGALLAVGVLSLWRYEVYRHRIMLALTDTIVLADVDNRTNDPVFDDALNSALRFEMAQTPYLNLLGLDKTS